MAVFVSQRILEGEEWVYYVRHDDDDGAWLFHPKSGITPESEMRVVGLDALVELDPTIVALADLPLGWCAWREEPGAEWVRAETDNPRE
ncbi:MAG: hypothetical protein KF819_40835 [Labilithrix sp.]|nr:hypothetical protein [Labilithrix sp.]